MDYYLWNYMGAILHNIFFRGFVYFIWFFQKAVKMATMTLIEEAKFSKTIDILVIYSGVLGVVHVQYRTPVCDRLHGIHFLSSKLVDI